MTETVRIQPPSDAPPSPAMERARELVGRVVAERYRVDAVLAAHDSGAVYLAEHLRLRTQVAFKVLRASAPAVEIARLEREAIAGAHVRHPNVAAVTDSGTLDDGSHYVAQEHVAGSTVRQLLEREGPMPSVRVVHVARQLLAALRAVHDQGIVHRDIEPRNVILTGPSLRDAKLIDFGRARFDRARIERAAAVGSLPPDEPKREPALTAVGILVGSTAYLPPEAALGSRELDARADLYSLGVVVYEMLAGKRPFDADGPPELFAEQREKPIPRIATRAPGVQVPAPVEAVLQRLLERDRNARYPTAMDALRALQDISGASPPRDAALARSVPVEPAAALPVLLGRRTDQANRFERLVDRGLDALRGGRAAMAALLRAGMSSERTGVPRWAAAAAGAGLIVLCVVTWKLARGELDASVDAPPVESAAQQPIVSVESAAVAREPASRASSSPGLAGGVEQLDGRTARKQLLLGVEMENWARATKAIGTLVEVDQAAFRDSSVVAAVITTALTVELAGGDEADAVFDALARRLGARGLEILFEIVRSRGGTKGGRRAAAILKEPDVMARQPPSLRIAFELMQARCDEKAALFGRAAEEGDERVLTSLVILREADCPRRKSPCCFEDNAELSRAIERLRERLGKPKRPPRD